MHRSRSIAAAESTWLGDVYEHEWAEGDYEMYFGDSGPCDKEGYRVDWIRTGMQNKTSSFLGWNWCNDVTLFNNSHLNDSAGTFRMINAGQPSVMVNFLPSFNDLASSIKFQRNPND
ncbi:hypothetical protein [Amycolatopsis magusensis]|uniref:hypothetical protein n=1 Tax=Amycolatopsis magusensis TaxID=882444 RepID=UPI0037A824BA